MKRFFYSLVFLVSSLLLLFAASSDAVYKVKKKEVSGVSAFENAEDERTYRLRQGQILTDGGYLGKGKGKEVWGKMEGLIEAPSDLIWRLYIQENDWKRYGLPSLLDSRAVSEEITHSLRDSKKVEDFYSALGNSVFDPTKERRLDGRWTNDMFQYYYVPWPLANRWFIVEMHFDETESARGIYRAEWTKAAGNVQANNGTILFEPFPGDPKKTRMLYTVEADPGSSVPRFLVRWAVRKTMPAAILAIRKEAARVQQKPPVLLKTQ